MAAGELSLNIKGIASDDCEILVETESGGLEPLTCVRKFFLHAEAGEPVRMTMDVYVSEGVSLKGFPLKNIVFLSEEGTCVQRLKVKWKWQVIAVRNRLNRTIEKVKKVKEAVLGRLRIKR